LSFNLKSTLKGDDYKMAKHPTCGKEVETPNKEWNFDVPPKQYSLKK